MPTPSPAAPEPESKAAPAVKAASADEDAIPCPIFDDQRGRPCGGPCEDGTLTCSKHRVRQTRTQISRVDAARRRGGR